jgi:hypothetical protein
MPKAEAPKRQDNPQDTFDAIIKAIDGDEFDAERHISIQIDETLRDAIIAARNSNKPASVTIAIAIKPGPDRRMEFGAKVTAKTPRPPTPAVTLFADAAGCLHKSDPRQTRLALEQITPQSQKEN